jgi:hypothetical protein
MKTECCQKKRIPYSGEVLRVLPQETEKRGLLLPPLPGSEHHCFFMYLFFLSSSKSPNIHFTESTLLLPDEGLVQCFV